MPRFTGAASCALLVCAISTPDAQAQAQYPTRSIRFIVPVTTGGPSDIVARLLSEKLAASLGKPVIVDNRPGASNTVGAALVAKAEPDGHTLLMAAANMATIQVLITDLPFDPIKDFAAVSMTHLTPYVVVVRRQRQPKTLGEPLE